MIGVRRSGTQARVMSTKVCLLANTINCPKLGGHLWAYLNWALGLRSLGCDVVWMEAVPADEAPEELERQFSQLKTKLSKYGLGGSLSLCSPDGELASKPAGQPVDFREAVEADLLLNIAYAKIDAAAIQRFRRSVLVDIDPGLTQTWVSEGHFSLAPHDFYVTIGENVGAARSAFPDCGIRWHHTRPPVFLPEWPVTAAGASAGYTTVTHWGHAWLEFRGESRPNGKREAFLPFLDLPRHTPAPLEIAVVLDGYEDERTKLEQFGWRVRDGHATTPTPWDYQDYVRSSRGEFSCAKPAYVLFDTAWVSDRTLCYLASGKPAVVQYTGPSRFLPDGEGLFRFRTFDEAARALSVAEADYDRHCRAARALAEEYFDAGKIVGSLLELALS
jgi:hypothetical protein